MKNRRKEDGRPKGTYKRFPFEQTKLGFMLKYEVAVVYGIIMNMTPKVHFPEPSLFLIETICGASKDPSFQKKKFLRYLEEYARDGLFCKRGKVLTAGRKVYYESVREKKVDKFIEQNRAQIEWMRKYCRLNRG